MFIRARTENQFQERRNEIINATEKLYRSFSFRQINFARISQETKIARSTIYNYYLNKEEIFLDIIERHYLKLAQHIQNEFLIEQFNKETFIKKLTDIFLKHYDLLILITYYLEQIEYVCSQKKLNDFKMHIKPFFDNVGKIAEVQLKNPSEEEINYFRQFFFSAMFGIVPACSPIDKQEIAMKKAGTYIEFNKNEFISEYLSAIYSKFDNKFAIWN